MFATETLKNNPSSLIEHVNKLLNVDDFHKQPTALGIQMRARVLSNRILMKFTYRPTNTLSPRFLIHAVKREPSQKFLRTPPIPQSTMPNVAAIY